MSRTTYVWDRSTGELVLKDQYARPEPTAPAVHGNLEEFVSPITKEVIHDRGQLRRHNKAHGVTDSRDYSKEFMDKRSKARDDIMLGNTKQAKSERIELINQELRKHGI